MSVKQFLQLTRAHTVPLEAVPAAIGAALAVGEVFHLSVLMWIIAGVLYHISGYGHNSVADWRNGYDKDDPNKQHHPLNNARMAKRVEHILSVYILLIITVVYVFLLAYPDLLSLGLIVFAAVMGITYNLIGKETNLKFIPISFAHSLMFIIPYLSLGGELNALVISLWVAVFLWVVYQIGVSGELTSLKQTDESNILRYLGVNTNHSDFPVLTVSSASFAYAVNTLKLLAFISPIYILSWPDTSIGMMLMAILVYLFGIKHLDRKEYNRDEILQDAAMIEAATLILFCWITSAVETAILIFIPLSIVWVVTFNYIEWGTFLTPKV